MNQFRLFPEEASNLAPQVDAIFWFEMAISAFFVLLFIVLIVTFAIRYRRRSESEVPPRIEGNLPLEVAWIVIPFAMLLVMFYWGGLVYVRAKRPIENATTLNVLGKQWMWKVQHPEGGREINEMHVPLGRPVKLVMASQDVIHDFSIPAFRIKQDVIPGAYMTQWFVPTQLGEYRLFCSQYCGNGHSQMIGRIVVMNASDYQAWLAGFVPDESPSAAGKRLFESWGCAACHGQRAPTMAGLYQSKVLLSDGSIVLADENYLHESILEPAAKIVASYPPIMPSYRNQLSEEQIFDLIEYIKTMQSVARPPGPGIPPTGPIAPMPAPSTLPVTGDSPRRIPNNPPERHPPGFDIPSNLKSP